jgi:hypothetical protein
MTLDAFLTILVYILGALLAMCAAAGLVEAIGVDRLARLLRLDVRESDQ